MATKARLQKGDLILTNKANTNLPPVTDGLIAHFPFASDVKGIQKFLSSGYFVVPSRVSSVEVLIVAGGGGGGQDIAGGGGGGGIIYRSHYSVVPGQRIKVTVGGGGAKENSSVVAANGGNSVFGTLTAIGGGGGGSTFHVNAGAAGGSGGGSFNSAAAGANTPGQGNYGGVGSATQGGGGGGAGLAGNANGTGGYGLAFNITGQLTYYAGGGAGASSSGVGTGGLGGGGTAGAVNGVANTGGGGAACYGSWGVNGNGGSGIVIVRWGYLNATSTGTNTLFTPIQPVEPYKNLIDAHYVDWKNPANWSNGGGNSTLTWDESQQCLVCNGYGWWYFNGYIQIDTSKHWWVEAEMKKVGPNGTSYLGDISYDKNFSQTTQHPGSFEYFGICGSTTPSSWTLYKNYTIGTYRTGTSTNAGDQATFDPNCYYIRPMFIANYSNGVVGTDITYIKNLKWYYSDADISNATLSDNGITIEEATTNLITTTANSYPTYGNEWGTYETNKYNSGNYFSIGSIVSVSNNIVTTATAHGLNTYDVIFPQTSGGGLTSGTRYFIKALNSTQFTLHVYGGTQDGSLGYHVHDSILSDTRIAVTPVEFPTMWWGYAHNPHSGLVKEIIPNGFNKDGRIHDCIRCHFEHIPTTQAITDGMAYGVYPTTVMGNTHTISFYHRAANAESIGMSIVFEYYCQNGYANTAYCTLTENWTKFTMLLNPTADGYCQFYWLGNIGGMCYDIAEIKMERYPHQTAYTASSRSRGQLSIPNILSSTGGSIVWKSTLNGMYSGYYRAMLNNIWTGGVNAFMVFMASSSPYAIFFYYPNTSGSHTQVLTSYTPSVGLEVTYAWVWNSSSIALWANGVKIGETTAGDIDCARINNSFDKLYLCSHTEPTYYDYGSIRDLSIYNRKLTDDEIKSFTKQRTKLKSSGLITPKVIEQPVMPVDTYYFPLRKHTSDIKGLVDVVKWTSPTGVTCTDTMIKKTGNTADSWDSGCVSVEQAYGNCYVEFKATETNTYKMMGLGNGNASASYGDIDFAWYPAADGNAYIYENGSGLGNYGGVYTTSDVFRVEAVSNQVKYYINGVLKYTSSTTPTYPLLVDCSFYTMGGSFNSINFCPEFPSVAFEDQAAWVGSSTLNLVTYPNLNNGWSQGYQTAIAWDDCLPPPGINSQVVSSYPGSYPNYGYWYSYGDYCPQDPSTPYTISLWVKTLDSNFTIYAYTADNSETGRYQTEGRAVPGDNTWHRVVWNSFTSSADAQSDSLSFQMNYGSANGEAQRTWFCLPQMEAKPFVSPSVVNARAATKLWYNLYKTAGMQWNSNWSIVYWKKPVGTSSNNFAGYSITQLGWDWDSSRILWFGKVAGANTIYLSYTGINAATVAIPDINKYFNNWQMCSLVKNGNTITHRVYGLQATPLEISVDGTLITNSAANVFVSPTYGYDLFLEGFTTAPSNSFVRDLVVAKRAFTNTELDTLYRTQMKVYKDKIQVQKLLRENTALS